LANYVLSNHDVIGPGWDPHVVTASYQRSNADNTNYVLDWLATASAIDIDHHDTLTATDTIALNDDSLRAKADTVSPTDVSVRTVAFARSNADTVSYATSHDFPFHFDRVLTNADTVTTTDVLTRAETNAIVEADTVTVTSSGIRSVTSARAFADTATAAITMVEEDGVSISHALTLTATDAIVVNYTASPAHHTETNSLFETFLKVVGYARSNADTATATDTKYTPESVLLPRMAYARHVYELPHHPNPSVVVQNKDWSWGSLAGARGTSVLILRQGREESLYKSAVGQWSPSGKSRLAILMSKGLVNFYEQYLNTVRQLSHWQVATYMELDAPWVTWASHRVLAGAPVANDSSPTRATVGTLGVEFANLKVKATFTGGTDPLMKITAWHRDIFPTSRGTWTEGDTEQVVTHNAEFTITNAYREVWLQCHTISGAPTGITVYISGTGN